MYDHATESLTVYNFRQGVNGNLEIYKCVEVTKTMTYNVFVAGKKVTTTHITNLPLLCSSASRLQNIIEYIDICKPCIGNSDTRFQPLVASRSGKFLNRSGSYNLYQACMIYHIKGG